MSVIIRTVAGSERLEALVRDDYERCHPGDTFADLKRRARFAKEDKGLLSDWMALAKQRARESTATPARDAA